MRENTRIIKEITEESDYEKHVALWVETEWNQRFQIIDIHECLSQELQSLRVS